MRLIQNQFFGHDVDKAVKQQPGTMYIATDTRKIYIYDANGDPRLATASGSGAPSDLIIVDTYADLPTGEPEDTIAFVLNSTGTPWLPGSLGGTYRPAGWYIYRGSVWISTEKLIDEALDDIFNHIASTGNPHNVTADQVGLGNVDNTSDADKPVSSATATALSGKANTIHTHVKADITDFLESDYATGAEGDLATSATQPGDNISTLNNDELFLQPSDNVSSLNNDSGYLSSGANVSEFINDSGYIVGQPVTSYRSDHEELMTIYSGWLDSALNPVIMKDDDGVQTFATGLTDLETDWTNRLSLTYI